MHIFSIKKAAFLFLFFCCLFSCGGSKSTLRGKYAVNEVKIAASSINQSSITRVEVFFETKKEFDGIPDGVDVVVRLPAELGFVQGSSFIYDNSTRDRDRYTPDDIVLCDTGEIFLLYFFSDADLFDRQIGFDANYGFVFEVFAKTKVDSTLVGAAAGRNVRFSCGEFFNAQKVDSIQVR